MVHGLSSDSSSMYIHISCENDIKICEHKQELTLQKSSIHTHFDSTVDDGKAPLSLPWDILQMQEFHLFRTWQTILERERERKRERASSFNTNSFYLLPRGLGVHVFYELSYLLLCITIAGFHALVVWVLWISDNQNTNGNDTSLGRLRLVDMMVLPYCDHLRWCDDLCPLPKHPRLNEKRSTCQSKNILVQQDYPLSHPQHGPHGASLQY